MTLTELKREFLEYLEIEKGSAKRTLENYDHYLSRFLNYAEKKHSAKAPKDAVVVQVQSHFATAALSEGQPGAPVAPSVPMTLPDARIDALWLSEWRTYWAKALGSRWVIGCVWTVAFRG